MRTDYYINWKDYYNEKGIINIRIDSEGYILLRNMDGEIDETVLCNILLSWTPIKSVIEEYGKKFNKTEPIYKYFVERNENGEDEFISYSKYDRTKIWHKNNDEKFDRDLKIFIPDLINYVETAWEGKFSNTESIDDLAKAAANLLDVNYVVFSE